MVSWSLQRFVVPSVIAASWSRWIAGDCWGGLVGSGGLGSQMNLKFEIPVLTCGLKFT